MSVTSVNKWKYILKKSMSRMTTYGRFKEKNTSLYEKMAANRTKFSESELEKWVPKNDKNTTLRDVFLSLPGYDDIGSLSVWMLENPASPIRLSGAIDLYEHDCVHCVLDRGLLNPDEAFVIGYTMGNDESLKSWEPNAYLFLASTFFPSYYSFNEKEKQVYFNGIELGRQNSVKNIH